MADFAINTVGFTKADGNFLFMNLKFIFCFINKKKDLGKLYRILVLQYIVKCMQIIWCLIN